ncbi:UDP-N-acetylmuramoyl-tripeptide--D-alanyl-D-alanine ligase [Candidatus Poribacteria bacterium]|nr:UDP-N-acetylmuramoyl-tripeptide--D-alanyl-D-alanine ligase [Candidatus Poribacteria bacterium]
MNLTISEILKATDGKLIRGDAHAVVTQVSTDSRTIQSGALFVALVGGKFDGHDFLEQVRQKGAIGAVVSRPIQVDLPNLIQVKDTLIALGNIANCHRRKFELPIVAITGSNGKTTTKDMTASVLAQRFAVFKSEKSYNNQIGIPLRLLQLTQADEIAVFEIGTSWPGEIERLSKMTEPTVGVITNIGPAHLELLGSIEGVAEEKGALLEHVSHAILNADDPMTPRLAKRARGQITRFGRGTEADVSADEVEFDSSGRPSFTLRLNGHAVERVKLSCMGKHNVLNALAAACVGVWAGLTSAEIRMGLENYHAADMRMQPIAYNGLHIINDAYNSNPDSLKSALEFFSSMETIGKRIAVLGDMLELGEHSHALHLKAGQGIPSNISVLITVGQHSREIARGATGRIESIISCETSKAAAQYLRTYAQAGDAVLIKGSRGMKLEQILEELMRI